MQQLCCMQDNGCICQVFTDWFLIDVKTGSFSLQHGWRVCKPFKQTTNWPINHVFWGGTPLYTIDEHCSLSSHLLDVTVLSEVRPTSLQVSKFKLIKHKSKVKSVAKVEFSFSWSLFPDQYLQRNEEVVHYALWGGARVEKRIVGNSL